MSDSVLQISAAPVGRRREMLVGTAFATAGVVAAFAALIGAYMAARAEMGVDWLAANGVPLTQPNMQMAALALSVVTMQWAVYSANNDDRPHALTALGVTIVLGLAFVNQTSFLFHMAGVTADQAEAPLFYAVTGGHLLLVVVGILFLVLVGFRAFGGQYTSRNPDGIAAAALYWHAVVAMYVVVWIAVYVMKNPLP